MNQALHRQRLQRTAELNAPKTMGAFTPQSDVHVVITPKVVVENPVAATAPVSEPVVDPQPADVAPVAAEAPKTAAVVPTDDSGMSPAQMRQHAKHTAEIFSQLSEADYQASMQSLLSTNPTLYSIVADELENLSAAAGEGDGQQLPVSEPTDPNVTAVEE